MGSWHEIPNKGIYVARICPTHASWRLSPGTWLLTTHSRSISVANSPCLNRQGLSRPTRAFSGLLTTETSNAPYRSDPVASAWLLVPARDYRLLLPGPVQGSGLKLPSVSIAEYENEGRCVL